MIPNQLVESILDQVDIVQIISEFVELKKKGSNYQGLSPFVNENTPSFVVSPKKRIFKCFSSGKSGGVVKFLKEYKGMSFPQAMQFLADKLQIEIPKNAPANPEDEERISTREALFTFNEFAASFFRHALPSSKVACDYANSRVHKESQSDFYIGYSYPDWHRLEQDAIDAGFSMTHILLSGLVIEKEDGQRYDFFRNRLMFPIHNHLGRVCGFAGRSLDGSAPKYLNITNTAVYNKSNTLYGLFFAQQSIRQLDYAIISEGYTDVISLHTAGADNAVAPCGTSLTAEHCQLLKRYTKNVLLLYDGDDPGQNAAKKNARILLENGLLPSVVQLPKEEDPDSFVRNNPGMDLSAFIDSDREAFPIWMADKLLPDTSDDPVLRNEAVKNLCTILSLYKEDSLVTLFIETIAKKFKIKQSIFIDKIREAAAELEPVESTSDYALPKDIDPKEFYKWGFYAKDNEYYFETKDGIKKLSNFIMKPLFHVESSVDTRRIFELTNYAGHKVTIDFDMTAMTSLVNFKRIIEGKGNFIFMGTDNNLMRLKARWYEETKTCSDIRNLGWQKEGFWAWSNGITTEEVFQPVDESGLVLFNNRHYFIPAFSNIYIDDKSIFLDERKFMFLENTISLRNWAELFMKVFGDNAVFGIAFFISSIFRDHILYLFNNFPILNLFGPKGTGKSQMAMSLSCLFGKQQTPFNIHNGTKAGLAEHIQQFINAFAWIDEYKNNIEYDKIETLKSIYDAIGRNRLNYDKGKKKETTLVNSAVILSGQEMPTADVALFSRVLFLQFFQTEYSSEEKENYNMLKAIEKKGLSHLTAEILQHRSFFVENYFDHYEFVLKDLQTLLNDRLVEDRILRSWCVILASIRTIESKVDLPFAYEDIRRTALDLLTNQNGQITSSNELAAFWDTVEAMADSNDLIDKWHFIIKFSNTLKLDSGEVTLPQPCHVLKLKFNAVYQLYSEHARRAGAKFLPPSTLKYYLETSGKYYIGREKSTKFHRKDYSSAEGQAIEQQQVTSSYCFNYDYMTEYMGINLTRELITAAPPLPDQHYTIKETSPFD